MNRIFGNFLGGRAGVGLLIIRVVFGAGILMHGLQKLSFPGAPFGWMQGSSMPGILQGLALFAEVGGGMALILGLLTPLAAFGIACTMVVAIATVHLPHGDAFVAGKGKGSFELAALYLSVVLGLIAAGPGAFSIDALLFRGGKK